MECTYWKALAIMDADEGFDAGEYSAPDEERIARLPEPCGACSSCEMDKKMQEAEG